MTFEDRLQQLVDSVSPVPGDRLGRAQARLDSLTKPPGSLGRLETLAAQVSCVQGDVRPDVSAKAVVLAAADHGVVAEGVSPYPQDVTAQMVLNFLAGGAAINQLAGHADAQLVLVDVGVAGDLPRDPRLLDRKLMRGTANMAVEPAMSREVAAEAVLVGADIAQRLAGEGVRLIATGEMGIGNTTAAAALTSALTGATPVSVVGPGTGLDEAGVVHKAAVVARALDLHGMDTYHASGARASELDPLTALAAVGGLEIAALAGVVLGGAAVGVSVVSDGYISGAATLVALRLCPDASDYVFASHVSAEPGHSIQLDAMGLEPVLRLDMRLGEGTGAALAMEIIDAACRCMSGMATFAEAGVSGADEE